MSPIANELDDALHRLDADTARMVEQLVRDALLLAAEKGTANGHPWPADYFDRTAGALAGEQFERPTQGQPEQRARW